MDKGAAKRRAHRGAFRILDAAIANGRIGEWLEKRPDDDKERIEKAYDQLVQYHFNRSDIQ